jgi:hypothetical protein
MVWYYCGSKFRGLRKFWKSWEILGFGHSSRQDAKVRKFLASYFAPSRPFGWAQDMLCGKYSDSFGCSVPVPGKDMITSQGLMNRHAA